MLTYYMRGINAVIMAWVDNDCKEPIEHIAKLLIDCVGPERNGKE